MADQRSQKMLAFNFASRTFTYKRLAQRLSSSVAAFLSFMREDLEAVVKADQCAQYVDAIGIAANNPTDLNGNIRAVFKCICQIGLKLTKKGAIFESDRSIFLAKLFHQKEFRRKLGKFKTFLTNSASSHQKGNTTLPGLREKLKNLNSGMTEKLNPLYKLLQAQTPINITSDLKDTFDSVNKALTDACQLAFKQPIPGKQLVLRTDVSFRSTSYALMIEHNPDQKIQSKLKTYAPVALGSKIFSPAQFKMSIC